METLTIIALLTPPPHPAPSQFSELFSLVQNRFLLMLEASILLHSKGCDIQTISPPDWGTSLLIKTLRYLTLVTGTGALCVSKLFLPPEISTKITVCFCTPRTLLELKKYFKTCPQFKDDLFPFLFIFPFMRRKCYFSFPNSIKIQFHIRYSLRLEKWVK